MYLDGIGLRAPGMEGWASGCNVLSGREPYKPSMIVVPECELLPAAERRRAVPSVKLALAVAYEAVAAKDEQSKLPTIFASSAGDSRTLHDIMHILTIPPRQVSPTRFHNSVLNAPAGYWHIASGCHEASTSVSCYDSSFAAGLLEASAQIGTDGRPVLFVAYDLPNPAPLDAVRPIGCSFGVAFHLTPVQTARGVACIEIELVRDAPYSTMMQDRALEALRACNPAARSLPILELVAHRASGVVYLDYIAGNSLAVRVYPITVAAVAGNRAGMAAFE